jgi:hypothetical protein
VINIVDSDILLLCGSKIRAFSAIRVILAAKKIIFYFNYLFFNTNFRKVIYFTIYFL